MVYDPIGNMDYATVVSDKKMKGSGLYRGDMVMVTGIKQAPEKRSDPYLTRTYVMVIKVVGDEHQLPNEKNDYQIYLVDPRNLEKVSEDEANRLRNTLR